MLLKLALVTSKQRGDSTLLLREVRWAVSMLTMLRDT
jgi:hypothetical protein